MDKHFLLNYVPYFVELFTVPILNYLFININQVDYYFSKQTAKKLNSVRSQGMYSSVAEKSKRYNSSFELEL